jgi:hypothetical protein
MPSLRNLIQLHRKCVFYFSTADLISHSTCTYASLCELSGKCLRRPYLQEGQTLTRDGIERYVCKHLPRRDTQHVPLWQSTGEREQGKQLKSGIGRLERLKRGNGIKGRDARRSGIEILMADAFAKINPTDPSRLGNQVAQRKRH